MLCSNPKTILFQNQKQLDSRNHAAGEKIMTNHQQAASITTRAMLVLLNINQWFGTKHDKKVSKEVADNHKSDVDMGRFNKRLVTKQSLENIRHLTSAARAEHYRLTLPWQDAGARILSSKGYFEYAEKMRKFQAQWEPAVAEFLAEYPAIIEDARRRLNGLFNDTDYPPIHKMRRKFSLQFNVLPMPTAKDFRVELGDEETERVRAEIEEQVNESIKRAMADVWRRIVEVVAHLKERLDAYTVDDKGAVVNPFRDSLVTNIRELLDILPTLNITQDAAITQFAARIDKELLARSADELRTDDAARQKTVKAAAEILKGIEDYI
jgi:hypothetical protein